jgi:hypothetical protein
MPGQSIRRVSIIAALCLVLAGTSLVASAASPGHEREAGARQGRALRYDGPGHGPDYPTAIAVAADGSRFFVAGSAYAGATSGDDYTVIAYGPTGRRLWLQSYNGPDSNIDQALGVATTSDGSRVFVTGYSFGGPTTTNDATTIAYDGVTGDFLWEARYDGPGHDTDVGADIDVSPDGRMVFVTGASIGADAMLDVLTLAYDADAGTQRWVARLGEGNAASDEGLAVGVSPDGARVYVTGYHTVTTADFVTVAYDAESGAQAWSRSIDAGGDELGRALVVSPNGSSVFVTGYRSGAPGAGAAPLACSSGRPSAPVEDDYITAAYDAATGRSRWTTRYDGPDHDCDQAYGIAVAADGSAVFVTGSSFSVASDSDVATVAYSAAGGGRLWVSRFDGPDHLYDSGDSLVASPRGNQVFVAGSSVGASTDYDFLTLFYDEATGDLERSERYDGPAHGFDAPNAIAVHPGGRLVYVTGGSTGNGLSPDFTTIVYRT